MHLAWPTSLDEAVKELRELPDATLLAGGTDLMVDVNFGRRRPEAVVALRRVVELGEWRDGRIGAGVTYSQMESGPHPGLAQAARTVGSPQIRNAGTLGGNLGTASPAGDTLPFLAAADASIELRGPEGTRTLHWDEFLVGPKRTDRRPGELITAALLPDDVPERQAFAKIGVRNAMVIAVVSVCVLRGDDGGTRVALGSAGPVPIRAGGAEEMISSVSRPGEVDLDEFARLVSEAARPISDHRSSEAYRRQAIGVLARRTLERVLR